MDIETRVIRVNTKKIDTSEIEQTVEILKNDGVIVYPTETFYGLGACCFSRNAIRRIYWLKGRKFSKPLSVLVSDIDMLRKIVLGFSDAYRPILSEFWPGPLTIIFKASTQIPEEITASSGRIGVRLPAYDWVRRLVREAGFPITGTSANISGEQEIAQGKKVIKAFNRKVELIADGGRTQGIVPSTVIDFTSCKPRILREGAVPVSRLKKYLNTKYLNKVR